MASIGSNSGVDSPDGARADFVVGLISHNDVRTIGGVIGAVEHGLSRCLASSDVRLVLADAHSTDGTRQAARTAASIAMVEVEPTPAASFAEVPYHGYPNRPGALRAVLQAADRLGARGCVLLDAAVETVTPEWIDRLLVPVTTGEVDYVAPYFARRVNEGAITRGIAYPMFRALYGVRLRQPVATEFACSGELIAYLLEQEFWDAEHAASAIDFWLASTAAAGTSRICEASLGFRASARETASDLSTTLAQVAGALFADVEQRADVWQRARGSLAVPVVGEVPEIDRSAVNVDGLVESFRLGYRELRDIWTWVLPPRTIVELRRLTEPGADRFRLDDRLWAGIIYDFAVGYSLRVLPLDHLLRSLTPLYSGWLASFVSEMSGASLASLEQRVERLCLAFEAEKRYLIARWRWPERLR